MTLVSLTIRSCYLAGPMRGYDLYNFPAFRRATAMLRDAGWIVFSPAERDEADTEIDHEENIAGWSGSRGLDYFMAHDLKAVCEHDAVILLPGWEESQGARMEAMVAVEVNHPVFEFVESGLAWSGFQLTHVENARVITEFVAGARAFSNWGDEAVTIPEQGNISVAAAAPLGRLGDAIRAFSNWEDDGGVTIPEQGNISVAAAAHAVGNAPEQPPFPNLTDDDVDALIRADNEERVMRQFGTGATRNQETDPDIYGFTSPLALGLFAEYMHKNRLQADGTYRDSDNWKKGIPLDSYMRSMRRHMQDLTLHFDGFPELAREGLEEALGGLFFNVQGFMHEVVRSGLEEQREEQPTPTRRDT